MTEVRVANGDDLAARFVKAVYDSGSKTARAVASIHNPYFTNPGLEGVSTGFIGRTIVHHEDLEGAITGVVQRALQGQDQRTDVRAPRST